MVFKKSEEKQQALEKVDLEPNQKIAEKIKRLEMENELLQKGKKGQRRSQPLIVIESMKCLNVIMVSEKKLNNLSPYEFRTQVA